MRRLALVASIGLALGMTACANDAAPTGTASSDAPEGSRYNVGVVQGGGYRSYQDALIKAWNDALPYTFTAVVVGGTEEAYQRLGQGGLQVVPSGTTAAYKAMHGIGDFKGHEVLVPTLYLYNFYEVNITVRKDSGITSIHDLTGKPFAAGARGTSTAQQIKEAFEVLGIKPNYFEGGLEDIVDAVKDGRLVGYAKSGNGYGLDSTGQEINATIPLAVVGFTAEEKDKISVQYPFYPFADVPADALYPGSPAHFSAAGSVGIGVVDGFPANVAEAMTRIAIEKRAELEQSFAALKGKDPLKLTIDLSKTPMHPGAVKYFESKGVTVPAEFKTTS